MTSAREYVVDLEPPATGADGRRYHASVVARGAVDGHWDAWLEFVAEGSNEVLSTNIETHQASEADLHRWAGTLGDVYLQGALRRALVSPADTAAHRAAVARGAGGATLDPFGLFALGEHVLRRELQLVRRAALLALIAKYDLNPRALDLSRLTKPQLVAFIATALGVRTASATRGAARE